MEEKPYLFSFQDWFANPEKYILVYAKDEDTARKKACKLLKYNSGIQAKEEDIKSHTYF